MSYCQTWKCDVVFNFGTKRLDVVKPRQSKLKDGTVRRRPLHWTLSIGIGRVKVRISTQEMSKYIFNNYDLHYTAPFSSEKLSCSSHLSMDGRGREDAEVPFFPHASCGC